MNKDFKNILTSHEVDAMLITDPVNVFYLSGFRATSPKDREGILLVEGSAVTLYTYQMFEEEAKQLASERDDLDYCILTADKRLSVQINHRVGKDKVIGFEGAHLTYQEFKNLSEKLDAKLLPMENVVEILREMKTEVEIEKMRKAIKITKNAFDFIEDKIKSDISEKLIAKMLEEYVLNHGAESLAFPTIVASGKNSAKPHHRTSKQKIGEGILLIDFGARVDGYNADLTRTFYVGKKEGLFEERYALLEEAKQAAIEKVAPGVRVSEIWQAAVDVLGEEAENFTKYHTLGHGLGLDIHESPRIYGEGKEELKPGMVITIEPGLYYPGWGGIRLEDDVLVTENGYEIL